MMISNETKLQNIRDYLDTLIGEYREAISSAIRAMEQFNISPEDFREESVNLNVAAFTLCFLNQAKVEKPRTIDPLQQVHLTPESKIELTPCV